MKSLTCFILVLILTSSINSQSSMIADVGTTIHVGTGAEICADVVIINGTFSGEGTICVSVKLNSKIFLEGPYNSGIMNTTLNSNLPTDQPYNNSPWNYPGTESVTSIPTGVVDWVLVELRSGLASGTKVARKAALLKSDGTIVDLDGSSPVKFYGLSDGNYYVVIFHRNHLAVISSSAQTFVAE